ncbi:MAG: hypothetical protein APF77_09870 [Clostridia bacterium BRH_c25]|nr:MAG: hypothetical protein APF77_09870 [Clostridia bacterium BRH_c25]
MVEKDIILDGSHMPDYDEIDDYIKLPARELWRQFNHFVQHRYKASPRIMYSKCSAKPGWNVKYQKSGKSLCTLYPEKDCFIALIVITLDLLPVIEALSEELTEDVVSTIRGAKPFNGTKWLMLKVNSDSTLNDVKQLLLLKHETQRTPVSKSKAYIV